jgi:DNA-binding transcriptional regulator LsrR (DeoR family)
MAGNITGFQRPFSFKANATYTTVGMEQAVTYVAGSDRQVEVPMVDNQPPVGIVTYQYEDRDGATIAVQLDRLVEATAAEAIQFGDDVIVAAGGQIKRAAGLAAGTKAHVLGEAQNNVQAGQSVQILINKKTYTV